jgi:hypothetical protein
MKLRSVLTVVSAAFASLGSSQIARGQTRIIDEGAFVVLKGGAPARTETFRIVRTVDGFITATGQLTAGTEHTTSSLSTDTSGTPGLYTLTVVDRGANVVKLQAIARGGRLSSMSTSKAGDEAMREFPLAPGRSLIVDAGLFHHLYFVALGKSPGAVQLIEPRAMRSSAATLSALGLEPVTVAGKSVTATHYSLVAGTTRYEFWVDARGRLLRVVAPDGLSATREELPR